MAGDKKRFVIIPSTTAGGLGDQAMVDVLVTQVNHLFNQMPDVLPNHYNVRSPARMFDFSKGFLQQAQGMVAVLRADRILMVGADILDGYYGLGPVEKRLRLAEAAHSFGARTRVIGCSFSETPRPEIVERLRKMPWLEIMARDAVSKMRMETALQREISLVADVAFLLEPAITTPAAQCAAEWLTAKRDANLRTVGLNVSRLVFDRLPEGTLERYAECVADRLAAEGDVAALIVPHDWRPGGAGDVIACQTLHRIVEARIGDRCAIVEDRIAAWDAKALAALLDAALLCRMHFAIACLGQGTPTYSLVSAGKFDGLMQYFGLTDNLFAPQEMTNAAALAAPVDHMFRYWERDTQRVKTALPAVLAASRKNFDDL